MQSWYVSFIEISLALLVMGYIFFRLVFSSKEAARRGAAANARRGFERREPETLDRRRDDKGPAVAEADRRVGPRR